MPTEPTALFDTDGRHWVPTALSRGPWDPRHCHGGPVAALLARAVEHADAGAWQVARLSVELTRPVPVGRPLTLDTDLERPGRKVSLVAGVLRDAGTEVARVRALRVRAEAVALPDDANLAVDPPMAPVSAGRVERVTFSAGDGTAFHRDACEHRFAAGSWSDPGPVEVWVRLEVPVIDGEAPSGVQRVAAAADFGNGVSGSLPFEHYLYINPDLTVHLLRPPVGEWVGMRTGSYYGPVGSGLAESALFDEHGRIGRSCQSLFVDAR
ncbi:MAG: thioesterase family protein [Actinobacteria bacterium]|uniref:Unannotated protein n=1 Tax=freshwater metagenome TaxID=449393 RepID=A0A6J6EPQ9_9ZZZZ|nr:thioesterase family protein [Actinomycetota bacterium]